MTNQAKRLEEFLNNKEISSSERSFGNSLKQYMERHQRDMTDSQWASFQRMEARYSPEVIALRQAWFDTWTPEKAENCKIAATYYMNNPPYFGRLSSQIMNDPEFIPSQKDYTKIVENKYVQKVIAMLKSEPIFKVGTLVQIRKTARGESYPLRNRVAMVVANNGPVTSAAKGSKAYTVLPFGESSTIDIKERYLKKKRR
tara:strand:- start:633 stop:1232 length:600 start_codon:yes stop_codon:yes gene_type:complete